MKDFLGYLLMAILVITTIILLIQIRHHKANIKKCLESQYKTKYYEVNSETHVLYCRSSDNSMQELKPVKPRSLHLDEHRRESKK